MNWLATWRQRTQQSWLRPRAELAWLKVTVFPGAIRIDLAKALDNALAHLKGFTRLIVHSGLWHVWI
jgi:hypothetical protein